MKRFVKSIADYLTITSEVYKSSIRDDIGYTEAVRRAINKYTTKVYGDSNLGFDSSYGNILDTAIIFKNESDKVIEQFSMMNRNNRFTIKREYGTIEIDPMHSCNIYAIGVAPGNDDETQIVSDTQIYNLNLTSGYRLTVWDYEPKCNLFFKKEFIECPDLLSFSEEQLRSFLRNLRAVCLNLIKYRCLELDEKFHTIAAVSMTIGISKELGLGITPSIISNAFGCTISLAEVFIDKYNLEAGDFEGLPWMI